MLSEGAPPVQSPIGHLRLFLKCPRAASLRQTRQVGNLSSASRPAVTVFYGFEWAIHPQMVKIALTACTLVMAFGALFSAWQTPFGYCTWLWLSAVYILAV
jgi:hypothetical protein